MTKKPRIGTSGWVYAHWGNGVFYPAKLRQGHWFAHYAGVFDTVEINNSFYRLPSEAAFDHWREQAPPGFSYAVKANRFLTHIKRLKDVDEALPLFLERARRLGPAMGPILYQLPPRWKANPERLAAFAALLDGHRDLHHVFEFRDARWFVEPVREILAAHGLSFCVFDLPGLPCPHWATGPIIYMRFHGAGVLYTGRYRPDELAGWAAALRDLAADRPLYIYFNNDAGGHAVVNALELREMMGG